MKNDLRRRLRGDIHRILAVAASVAAVLSLSPPARAAEPSDEPVRRDARLEIGMGSPFLSGTLVIPSETTGELARFARRRGGAATAEWLCDAYALAPSFDPGAASLRGLIDAAVDGDRVGTAGALVCPRLRKKPFQYVPRDGTEPTCIYPAECDEPYVRVRSPDLSYPDCQPTAEHLGAFDAGTCRRVLAGRSRRAPTLRYFLRRAARRGGCLALHLKSGIAGGIFDRGKPARFQVGNAAECF